MKKEPLNPYAIIKVDGIFYDQVVESEFEKGDMVVDVTDPKVGYFEMLHEDEKHIAVRWSSIAVEVGVPKWRVRKLVPRIPDEFLNPK